MARAVEVDSGKLSWAPTRWPGISRKSLRDDPSSGARASLLKLEPKARLPRHMHPAGEEVFVLEGRVRFEDSWLHFSLAAERQAQWAAGKLQHPPAAIPDAPPIRALFRTIWDVDREWMPEIRELVAREKRRGKRTFEVTALEQLDRFLSRTDL